MVFWDPAIAGEFIVVWTASGKEEVLICLGGNEVSVLYAYLMLTIFGGGHCCSLLLGRFCVAGC